MFGIGGPELVMILIIGLVIFGPGKLPEIGSSVGRSMPGSSCQEKPPLLHTYSSPPAPSANPFGAPETVAMVVWLPLGATRVKQGRRFMVMASVPPQA